MGSLMCPLCCGREFSSRVFLKNHLLSLLENLHCSDCNQKFDNIRELATHLNESCTETLRITDDALPEASVNVNTEVPVCDNDLETTKRPVENLDDELGTSSDVDIPGVSHYCSTCDMHITSVVEHITLRHPNETVYYYKSGTEEDEVEDNNMSESGVQTECDPLATTAVSESHESNRLAEEIDVTVLKQTSDTSSEEMSTPSDSSEAADTNYSTQVRECGNNSAPDEDGSTFSIRSECMPQPVYSEDFIKNVNLPEASGTSCSADECTVDLEHADESILIEDESTSVTPLNEADTVVRQSAIPTTLQGLHNKVKDYLLGNIPFACEQKIASIEKFLEQAPYRGLLSATLNPLHVDMKARTVVPVAGLNISAETKVKVLTMIRNPKVLPIDADGNLKDLFKRGATSTGHNLRPLLNDAQKHFKRYILRGGKFVEEENSAVITETGSVIPTLHATSDVMEDRVAILKFIKVCVGECAEMVPIYSCSKCKWEFGTFQGSKIHWNKCTWPKENISLISEVSRDIKLHLVQIAPAKKIANPTSAAKRMLKKLDQLWSNSASSHSCDICNTKFPSAELLKKHERVHNSRVRTVTAMNNTSEYHCDVCTMVSYSRQAFRSHYVAHFPRVLEDTDNLDRFFVDPEELGTISCKVCSMTLATHEALKAHWAVHHPEVLVKETRNISSEETIATTANAEVGESFTCNVCGKVFAENVREMHEKSNCALLQFRCTICSKPHKHELDLNRHMLRHSANNSFRCRKCQINYPDATALKVHINKKHGGLIERPFPCKFCAWRFKRAIDKVRHEWIHTGYKPYSCNICGFECRTKSNLSNHKLIHINVHRYSCGKCGRAYRSNLAYKDHMLRHMDARGFPCKICPKSFKTNAGLHNHNLTHAKQFTCVQCGRKFATIQYLDHHSKLHALATVLKHKCHVCGAMYGRAYMLKNHIEAHDTSALATSEEVNESDSEAVRMILST